MNSSAGEEILSAAEVPKINQVTVTTVTTTNTTNTQTVAGIGTNYTPSFTTYTPQLTLSNYSNLTFRKELERQCHMQMLILLFVAFAVGCLLIISVRAINKYWCPSRRRRVFWSIPETRSNRSDHYVTSIVGGITPPRIVQQNPVPVQQEEIQV